MSDAAGATAAEPLRELSQPLKAADYHRLARSLGSAQLPGLRPLRVAVLGSFSMQFLRPFLVVEGARRDFAIDLHFGAFGQLEQELIDDSSELWKFAPQAVVIALRPEDVDVDAVVRYYASHGRRFEALADDIVERIQSCVGAARDRVAGPILVANVAPPASLPLGQFDAGLADSLTHGIAALNKRLAETAAALPGTFIWDYAGLVRSRGTAHWTDPRLWALARAAVAADHQPALAAHLMRAIAGTLRAPAKCLVLDLDNTLWGGVIGDDGPGGIQIADDYPGSVYKQFQRAALALSDRGVLLAVSSKNNPDVVEETLRSHPEMLLKWDDFACVKANWRPKSENLREIARELNIGLDALVLFDENPVERAEVSAALPEVGIIDVPADPMLYVAALNACEHFDQAALQAEDRDRVAMYRREGERRALAQAATTPEEFLRGLEMEAEVGLADEHSIGRIAQLVAKTNQFNLTTRRYSQSEIAAMARDPGYAVGWLRLRDRFGDQGLVTVGIVRRDGKVAEIDTFLMSCRVMNRRVEHAFMAFLLEHARRLGCEQAIGTHLPTAKNTMTRELYPALGFTRLGDSDDGGSRFRIDLSDASVEWPAIIRRR